MLQFHHTTIKKGEERQKMCTNKISTISLMWPQACLSFYQLKLILSALNLLELFFCKISAKIGIGLLRLIIVRTISFGHRPNH